MPLPPSAFSSDRLAPSHLGYETYNEMAKTRAAAQASVAFQALQTGLMVQMQGTLHSIEGTIQTIRQQQADALAIQQEMLQRDQVQAQLEEFIYQSENLVKEFRSQQTDIPPSSRYFLLTGVIAEVQQNGIGTAVIRGRDNKAAFDTVLKDISGLITELEQVDEVKEAIAWADAEAKRLAKERKAAEQERRKQINALKQKLGNLKARRVPVTMYESFQDTVRKLEKWGLLPKEGTARKVVIAAAVCVSPVFIFASPFIIFGFWADAKRLEQERNQELDEEIATVTQQLRQFGE